MSAIQTPERSFILKGSVSTSLLEGENLHPVRHGGDQSSDPAHITAVTWTAGDLLAQVKICPSVPRSDILLSPFHVSYQLLWAEKNWSFLSLATVFFLLWMLPAAQL